MHSFFFKYSIGRILKYQSELTDKTDAFTQFVFERNRKINFLAKREDSNVKFGLLLNDFAVYMYNFATVLSLLNWFIVIFSGSQKQCEQVMSIPIAAAQIIHDGLKIGLRHDSKEIVFTANSASIAEEWSKLFREKQPSLVVRPQTPVAPRKPPLRRSTHLSGGADAAKRTRRLSLPCWAAQLESAQHTPPFVERPEARAHVLVVHTAPEWARELSLPKRAWRGSGSCSSAASPPSLPKQKKHTLSFDDAEGHVGKSLSFAESTGQTPRLPPTPRQKAPQQPRRNSVDPAPPTPERQTGLLLARHPPMHASKSQTIAIPSTLLPHPLQTAHEPAADDKGKKLKLVKDWTASKLDQITAFLSGLEKASTDSATLARNFKLAKEIQSAFIPAEKYVSVPPPPLPKQMCVDEMKIKFALITMEIRLIKVVSNIKSALVKVTLEERDALNVIVECTRKAFGFLPK